MSGAGHERRFTSGRDRLFDAGFAPRRILIILPFQSNASRLRQKMRYFYNALLTIASLAIGCVLCELALRSFHPEFLVSYEDLNIEGLPEHSLSDFLLAIRENKPRLVVIGDSFVDTGTAEGGWVEELKSSTGLTVSAFGLSGASPYHYFSVYDHVRAIDPDVPVLILFYIGNDLVDESILQSVAPRYERYFDVRYEVYSNGRQQPYFPCFVPGEAENVPTSTRILGFLQRKFAASKLVTLAVYRIKGLVSSFEVDGGPVQQMAADRCNRPPHSVMVKDRLFFFDLHNFSVDSESISNKESASRIERYLAERAGDKNLILAIALSREEVCKEFHNVPVKEAKGLIKQFAGVGLQMIDPNPVFSQECLSKELYLPDGHWNSLGHKLFSEIIRTKWMRK
jgi:hypothetical protein